MSRPSRVYESIYGPGCAKQYEASCSIESSVTHSPDPLVVIRVRFSSHKFAG